MKIIELQAENVKKLIAVRIAPTGNLVEITGKNGQGKTSVLDSIWWALSGAANIQGSPIRKGEEKAVIRLDLGEFVVTRTFKKSAEENYTTSTIKIENAEGTAIRQPQSMLDKLIGELSFDPLGFARMTKKEQFEQLKRFVPGVDFAAIEKAQQEDYDLRTNINRQAHQAKIMAEKVFVSLPAGAEPIDESALVDELEGAGKHNTDIETRKANREKLHTESDNRRKESDRLNAEAEEMEKKAAVMRDEAVKLLRSAVELNDKLLKAPALPEPIDVAPIKARIAEARELNKMFEAKKEKERHLATVEEYTAQSDEITTRMNARQKDKEAKIAAASLPVPELGFGENEILLNGVPFNQGSDAEQLRASIAMAMALNPKLRVIRVRDGSLLDDESMAMLQKMAEDQDYQVWVETVKSDNAAAVVLEEGHIKGVESEVV